MDGNIRKTSQVIINELHIDKQYITIWNFIEKSLVMSEQGTCACELTLSTLIKRRFKIICLRILRPNSLWEILKEMYNYLSLDNLVKGHFNLNDIFRFKIWVKLL